MYMSYTYMYMNSRLFKILNTLCGSVVPGLNTTEYLCKIIRKQPSLCPWHADKHNSRRRNGSS